MSFNTNLPIDFTGFTGAGFQSVPASGQLDSDFWRVQGFSDAVGGDTVLDYGETAITANTDYARGVLSGDPTTAGVYAVNTGVPALGTSFVIQPTGGEFGTTPGTITLRVQYTGASPLTSFTLDYDGVFRNSGDRSSTVNFSYAVQSAPTQPASFSATLADLSFATPVALVAGATFTPQALNAATITGAVNPGDFIFLRWSIGDNTVTPGAGSRDEVGFDNISITAGGGTPATPTISLSPTTLSLSEGNAGSTAFNYAISRSDATPGDATVSVTIQGGAGFTAADITSVTLGGVPVAGFTLGTPFNATLSGSATSAALVVNVAGDTTAETNESFSIAIAGSPAGYTVGNAAATGTVLDDDSSTVAISDVQGTGRASPLVGNTVTIQGVVTGDYQNGDADAGRNLQGFFVQMVTGDGNPLTSDGIFVYQADAILGTNVNVGDIVRVTGSVVEAFGATQVSVSNSTTGISVVTAAAYTPAQVISQFALDVNLPSVGTVVAGTKVIPDLEFAEGMLIRIPQTVTISEAFNADRFGEVRVAAGGQVTQFTQANLPSQAGYQAYLNDLGSRSLLIDDGLNVQNPNPITFLGSSVTTATAPQIGDSLTGLVGNLGYDFDEYRLQPANSPTIIDSQPRTAAPGRADGDIKIVGTNLLNYFTTLDTGSSATTGPGNAFEPRGANNAAEFARQTQKLYTALTALDADLIIVNELENNGFGAGSAIRTLVDGFNASLGTPGRWSYVDPGVTFLGGDAIKVSMLYRTDKLALATGTTVQVLDDSDIPGLITANLLPADFLSQSTVGAVFNGVNTSRAVLVASFQQIGSGEVFTAAAVHNKSKSGIGTGLDSDQNDGAGNWNNQRALATQALDAFLKTNPTGTADADKIILGDFNSYAIERSTKFLTDVGYRNLIADNIGNANAASYVFDGQKGYLDYAFSSTSLKPYVRSVDEWRVNSPEFDGIDYNTDFGRPTTIFDATVPYRYSDHDPVVVNLKLDPGLLVARGGATVTVGDSFVATSQGAQAGDTITVRKAAAVTDGANAGIYTDNLIINTADTGYFGLGTGVVTVSFTGTGNVSAVGNALGNTIQGNAGDNSFAGGEGDDVLNGALGTDQLFGGTGNDTLDGGAGNDALYGGAGNDSMIGGDGNDAFVVDDLGDIIVETGAGGGTDTAFVNVNGWSNFANVEIVRLGGSATVVFGSAGNEDLVGNQAFGNSIDGQAGDDTLWGSALADVLNGNLGNDILRGQGGADLFFGGLGNDQFVVFDAASVIVENAAEGYDIAYFAGTGTFSIGNNVEEARLAVNGTGLVGNASDNLLVGSNAGLASFLDGGAGRDIIFGTAAADTIIGGAGDDTFYSQGGNDVFRYDATGWGADQIAGFAPGAHLQFTAASGVTAFSQLDLNIAGGNTQVNAAGGTILVFGASLTANDFIFG